MSARKIDDCLLAGRTRRAGGARGEPGMTTHRLDPEPGTTADVLSRDHVPALTIDPGDTIVVRSLDAAGHLERQTSPGERRPQLIPELRGHCLTGPIAVRGAGPGDVLALRLVALRPDDWGFTVAAARDSPVNRRLGLADGPAAWLLWELDADAGRGTCDRGFSRALAPFLGVMGLPPAEPGEHSTVPPRTHGGGNIDCKDLVAGATLYLPVTVPGALLYLGDGHAAQGDGEVGGTAIETGMTTEAVVDVVSSAPVAGVHAETPAGRITFGFDADLNVAMGDALDAMVGWMQSIFDLDKGTALALASTCVDLRVTQVANQTWGVHALLPDGVVS
jgi:acetamidase/formamidase